LLKPRTQGYEAEIARYQELLVLRDEQLERHREEMRKEAEEYVAYIRAEFAKQQEAERARYRAELRETEEELTKNMEEMAKKREEELKLQLIRVQVGRHFQSLGIALMQGWRNRPKGRTA